MTDDPPGGLTPEREARRDIDAQLAACGWVLQDHKSAAVAEALGVAVREVPVGVGRADYVLFVDCQAVGVIEAKPVGTTLTGVEAQTLGYRQSYPGELPAFDVGGVLPFGYESTGVETRFTCGLDPVPTSRRVFSFHRPETMARWIDDHIETKAGTLRAGLQLLPDLDPRGLWTAQAEAIRSLEESLRANRPRALVQMATGAGKTFTAVNAIYRLVRHAGAQRVLFLVDRATLGVQAVQEFEGFDTPDDGRKFTELYNVRRLTSSHLDIAAEGATKVHVSTIQRLYSLLRGEELDEALDERSGFEVEPEQPVEVVYNPAVPIESYDVIVVDECHRSIYGVWRQVLEYFDALLVGLTATPGIQTHAFFLQNLVTEYLHAEAVADRVNVDFDVFRIRTEITEGGGTVPAGFVTEFRDRLTRQQRLELVDEDVPYDAAELDRRVVAPDQIRTIVKTLRDSLPKMFPDRERRSDGKLRHVPKTLIFAKDDSHADDIVQIVREEFGLGNEGAVKITYRSGDSGHRPEQLLQQFRNAYNPRIAVTVDLIATGTDVKPIECVVFMRRVRSRNYFEQMKGRGVRVIDPNDLRAVTPDATVKDRFVLVDAVGVTDDDLPETVPLERKRHESFDQLLNRIGLGSTDEATVSSVASRLARLDLPETVPLERKRHESFDQLLNRIGLGSTDEATVSSVASRLARLDQRMTAEDRAEVEKIAGMSLSALAPQLVKALDPDRHVQAAAEAAGTDDPTDEQIAAAREQVVREAVQPLAGNPQLREKLIEVRRSYEQMIDSASADKVISEGFSVDATDRARRQVESFRKFIEENRDQITALQVLYDQPRGGFTYDDVRELANAIARPPHRWTTKDLWAAYETLDDSKVRGSGHRVNTDLVSLVRYTLGLTDELVAYPDQVNERFDAWLHQQRIAGRTLTDDQIAYLSLIRDHLATSLVVAPRDLQGPPFSTHGGLGRARQLFGEELAPLMDELTEVLVA